MQQALQIKEVSHVYVTEKEASLAIEKISLDIAAGEFVSLVGPSGCGKTTLLSIMAGLIPPTAGQVTLAGSPINGPHRGIGYMLQQDYLFPWRTIWRNATLGPELRKGVDTSAHFAYVQHLLQEMGLSHVRHLYPRQLSGGMRQRVALVRTLATKPDVLLLDEPFSALDYQTRLQLEDLVFETIRSRQKTAVLVTHDISEAIAMSDRVIILNANPGTIRREVVIPPLIRQTLPFHAREQAGFHELFHTIWQEFEAMKTERSRGESL
ncbi:ABC transporter ATP-binding protein [Marinicrinis sediminis]|uniref:ABC transporter ATP-binding protein n=1 Tax=Marinicrinis sediminis TaxID=1652465 RepID=A0ABW5R6H4_9BACL